MNVERSHRFRTGLIALLCVSLLTTTTPRKVEAQDLVEYALLAAFISLVALTAIVSDLTVDEGAYLKHKERLQTSVDAAALAHEDDQPKRERAQLSRAGGAASAMFGQTASCGTALCDEARGILRDSIALIAVLKARTFIDDTCGNHVIDEGEECDPSSKPDGCETRGESHCSAECFCVSS